LEVIMFARRFSVALFSVVLVAVSVLAVKMLFAQEGGEVCVPGGSSTAAVSTDVFVPPLPPFQNWPHTTVSANIPNSDTCQRHECPQPPCALKTKTDTISGLKKEDNYVWQNGDWNLQNVAWGVGFVTVTYKSCR
jgi:hypothetical protein